MSETVRRMLVRGIAATHAGDHAEARRYLERVLYNDATREQKTQAHLWLSRIATDPAEQREHLEDVLAADPVHAEARKALAILDGQLDPNHIIDADHLPPGEQSAEETPRPLSAQRFICPKCAGRVRFEPSKSWLECTYCGHREPMLEALQSRSQLQEQDFVVTLATAQGHTVPAGTRVFTCRGCQATLLTSGAISTRCPYCGSAHIVEDDAPTTIPPEGIVPFGVDEAEATSAFRRWLDRCLGHRTKLARTTRPRGLYLPIWTFDLMGEIAWRGYDSDDDGGAEGLKLSLSGGQIKLGGGTGGKMIGGKRLHEGTHYVILDDVIVPATHKVPYALREIFDGFDLDAALPYDAALLSDWPAEIYDVMVSDASLVARRRALDGAHEDVRIQATSSAGGNLQNFQVFSRSLAVQAYKLLMVPVWLANYRLGDSIYAVAVNGQTGRVYGESPPRGLGRLIRELVGRDTG